MKNYFFLAAIMLFTASCSVENIHENVEKQNDYAEVRVNVNDFTISVGEFPGSSTMTRTENDVSTYTDVKAITLAFYDNEGTEVFKEEHNKEVANTYTGTFGAFSLKLPIGSYTMVVIGRGYYTNDVFTLTSPTEAAYTTEKPRETFCHTQAVDISTSSPVNLAVTLNRICSKFDLLTTDVRTYPAEKIRVTLSAGGKSFNPTTGLAIDNNGYTAVYTGIGLLGSYAFAKGFLFLASDEQNMTVTIEALDGNDAVLFSRVVNDVPFKRNRVTNLRGTLFSDAPVTASFKVESEWIAEQNVNF